MNTQVPVPGRSRESHHELLEIGGRCGLRSCWCGQRLIPLGEREGLDTVTEVTAPGGRRDWS